MRSSFELFGGTSVSLKCVLYFRREAVCRHKPLHSGPATLSSAASDSYKLIRGGKRREWRTSNFEKSTPGRRRVVGLFVVVGRFTCITSLLTSAKNVEGRDKRVLERLWRHGRAAMQTPSHLNVVLVARWAGRSTVGCGHSTRRRHPACSLAVHAGSRPRPSDPAVTAPTVPHWTLVPLPHRARLQVL